RRGQWPALLGEGGPAGQPGKGEARGDGARPTPAAQGRPSSRRAWGARAGSSSGGLASPPLQDLQGLRSANPCFCSIQGKIVCSQVKEVRLASGICLELNETSSCEDFRKRSGEELAQVLCQAEPAGAGPCSWLLAQSEVRPHCLLLVVANGTELSSKLQFLREHQSDLTKVGALSAGLEPWLGAPRPFSSHTPTGRRLSQRPGGGPRSLGGAGSDRGMASLQLGIHNLSEEAVSQHQSYSRKTLIALVTSGVLLAILGVTGYFLMNRRSWSPSGERLDEDPYYTEHGAGLGRGTGPETSPGAQGKARAPRGAQENGTGQATSRNGHSPRQHVVADTEL
ncbi:Hematopoietic progenitor cell antigen CD34, partial [Galemys pyrenaicus]